MLATYCIETLINLNVVINGMKLQQSKVNQFNLTIPAQIVKGFGWTKGTELKIEITGKEQLTIKK